MDTALRVAIGRALAAHGGVRLAIAFGSQARGRARPTSDVDVAVAAPGADLLEIGRQLALALGREVDVVDLDAASIPLLDEILRDGVAVYEARPGVEAEFRARAIADLEIDRPWYERMRDAWLARLATGGG